MSLQELHNSFIADEWISATKYLQYKIFLYCSQPYEGRLLLTSWWRKSSSMTVGQSSLISFTHHCYD